LPAGRNPRTPGGAVLPRGEVVATLLEGIIPNALLPPQKRDKKRNALRRPMQKGCFPPLYFFRTGTSAVVAMLSLGNQVCANSPKERDNKPFHPARAIEAVVISREQKRNRKEKARPGVAPSPRLVCNE